MWYCFDCPTEVSIFCACKQSPAWVSKGQKGFGISVGPLKAEAVFVWRCLMARQVKRPTEFLTDEEIQAILKQPDRRTIQGKRDYAILLTMLTTGLRKAELCSLKVSDIKPYRNGFVIEIIGKYKRHRRLSLRKDIIEAIQVYWDALKGEDDHVFHTLGKHGPYERKPLTPRAVDCLVEKVVRKACLKKRVTPHSLRHTACTHLLYSGADVLTAQKFMGHSSPRTTEVYLHQQEERVFEAQERLSFNAA